MVIRIMYVKALLLKTIFKSNFKLTAELRRRYADFPITLLPLPPTSIAFRIINISHQSDTFVRIIGPILLQHYHPKSITYIRVHSQCCAFCGLGKCTTLQYQSVFFLLFFYIEFIGVTLVNKIIQCFHYPKNPLRLPVHPSLP